MDANKQKENQDSVVVGLGADLQSDAQPVQDTKTESTLGATGTEGLGASRGMVQTSEPAQQPDSPFQTSEQIEKPKKSSKTMWTLVAIVGILALVGIVAGLIVSGVIKFGGSGTGGSGGGGSDGGSTETESTPGPELARSVCAEYDGVLQINENSAIGYTSAFSCENDDPDEYFYYTVSFADSNKWEQILADARTEIGNGYKSLEDSDTYLKAFLVETVPTSVNKRYEIIGLYDNAVAKVSTYDPYYAENLLVKLGFPDRSKSDNYEMDQTGDGGDNSGGVSDVQYMDDVDRFLSQVNQYQANNRGSVPAADGWDDFVSRYLTFENQTFSDPATGELYVIKPFESFVDSEFINDESPLNSIPMGEIYVFYNSKCNGNKVIASDNARNIAVVRSSLSGDKYYCRSN